jgi:hypothetical protein
MKLDHAVKKVGNVLQIKNVKILAGKVLGME